MTSQDDFNDGGRNERFIILQMVQDGTVSPEEGARLLEAVDRAERKQRGGIPKPPAPPSAPMPPKPPAPMRDVHLLVSDRSGRKQVNLTLPLALVETVLRMANRFAPGKIPDLADVWRSIHEDNTGTILDIDDGNDRIQITIQER